MNNHKSLVIILICSWGQAALAAGEQQLFSNETDGSVHCSTHDKIGKLIGTFIFECNDETNVCEIFGNIEEQFRGQGYGPKLRNNCISDFKNIKNDVGIKSMVNIANYPSLSYNIKSGMIPVGIDCSGEVLFVDSPETYNKLGNVAQYYKLNIADHDLEYCEKKNVKELGRAIYEGILAAFTYDREINQIAEQNKIYNADDYYKFLVIKSHECCGLKIDADGK